MIDPKSMTTTTQKSRYLEVQKEIESLKEEMENKPIICTQEAIKFEVHPKTFQKVSWQDATDKCSILGKGWRLPTRIELLIIYINKDDIGNFETNYYWSSTQSDNSIAWLQYFFNGDQDITNKKSLNYFRPVRSIK